MTNDLIDGYYISSHAISSNIVDRVYEPLIAKISNIDILAIGSSRLMQLHKEFLFDKEKKYYNFSDTSANLRHYARIIGLLKKHNVELPKIIILGLDPWVFDKKRSLSTIDKLLDYKNYAFKKSKFLQLFDFEYTRINLVKYLTKVQYLKSKDLQYLKSKGYMILAPSGDMYYPNYAKSASKLTREVEDNITKCKTTNKKTLCVNYEKLNNFNEFIYFINYLKSNGTRVVVYLSPFEPRFYNYMVKHNNFNVYEHEVYEMLKFNGVKSFGGYNPKDLGLSSLDFIDALHLSPSGSMDFFKKIGVDPL